MKQKTTELKKDLTQSEVDKANHFFKKAFDFSEEKNMPRQSSAMIKYSVWFQNTS